MRIPTFSCGAVLESLCDGWGQVVVIEVNLFVLTSRQSAPRSYVVLHDLGQITDENHLSMTAHYGDLSSAIRLVRTVLVACFCSFVFQ